MQFIWDLISKFAAHTSDDCARYYHANSLIQVRISRKEVFIIAAFKFISLSSIPIGLYIVFYEMNKHQFRFEGEDLLLKTETAGGKEVELPTKA